MHRCAYPRVWPYMALFLPNLNLRDDFNLTPVLIHVLNRDDFRGSKGFNPSLNRARFATHVEGETGIADVTAVLCRGKAVKDHEKESSVPRDGIIPDNSAMSRVKPFKVCW